MSRPSFRELLQTKRSLVMPAAHDALTARLVEQAGFEALAISGSSMLATRYGLPDVGLAGLGDMLPPTRDMLSATSLPCLGDGDDGYGDLKSVVRTVRQNEAVGLSALVLEDQSSMSKLPGQTPAKGVIGEDDMAAKLQAAVRSRDSSDFWIMGRTDSYATLGVDGAMKRADRYLASGADGIFIAGVRTEADLATVGRRFSGVPMIAVIYGGEGWPNLSVKELTDLGYTHIVYPLALILPICLAVVDTLKRLREATDHGGVMASTTDQERARAILNQAVELDKWLAV